MAIRYSSRETETPTTAYRPLVMGRIGVTTSWAEASARIIETLDEPGLPGNLTHSLSTLVKFDQCKIMVFNCDASPVLVYDSHPRPNTRNGVANFIDRSYLINPFYNMYISGAAAGVHRLGDLRHFAAPSIDYTAYRVRPKPGEEIGFLTEGLQGGLEELCIGIDMPGGGRALIALTRDRSEVGFSTGKINLVSAMTPFLAAAICRYWRRSAPSRPTHSSKPACDDRIYDGLSPREHEVVQLIIRGHSSPSIALTLDISLTTVKTHRKNIYAKLRIASQCELFSHAAGGSRHPPLGG